MKTLPLFKSPNSRVPKGLKGIDEKTLRLNVPEVITKELAITRSSDGSRRIRLSSNYLQLMGLKPGSRTSHVPTGHMTGFEVQYNPSGRTKIYERKYNRRSNNPTREALIDIQNQALISQCIPRYTERLHFEIRHGSIKVRPLPNHTHAIRTSMRQTKQHEAFVALTSGVDCRCLLDNGITIKSTLEFRPNESRDKSDLSETGTMTILANAAPKFLFNQDISKVDWRMMENIMEDEFHSVCHISLPCEDFSNCKNKKEKERAIDTLETSIDLVYDALRLVETIKPGIVIVENIPMFKGNKSELLTIKLRKWGYHVTEMVLDARDYGATTSRKRYYMIASIFPNYKMPKQTPRRTESIWPIIEEYIDDCRDISHTSSIRKGINTGRLRPITKESHHCGTILKSQNRQNKDMITIFDGQRYLIPNEDLLKRLSSIPSDFNLNAVSSTIASEQIGQSIDYSLHDAVIKSVTNHMNANKEASGIQTIKTKLQRT